MEVLQGLVHVLRDPLAVEVHVTDVDVRGRVAHPRGLLEVLQRRRVVLRDATTLEATELETGKRYSDRKIEM